MPRIHVLIAIEFIRQDFIGLGHRDAREGIHANKWSPRLILDGHAFLVRLVHQLPGARVRLQLRVVNLLEHADAKEGLQQGQLCAALQVVILPADKLQHAFRHGGSEFACRRLDPLARTDIIFRHLVNQVRLDDLDRGKIVIEYEVIATEPPIPLLAQIIPFAAFDLVDPLPIAAEFLRPIRARFPLRQLFKLIAFVFFFLGGGGLGELLFQRRLAPTTAFERG